MTELVPRPMQHLAARMLHELRAGDAIFDLPKRKHFSGLSGRDLSVTFHGRRAATPLGPAAGPHSQLAQNVVLAWLGGSRIVELKTVQVLDDLVIPRPCIDMRTVGYNVEWSQELKLEQSLDEYVKASMLIEMLAASPEFGLPADAADTVLDMSVGYDLAGISGERVDAFLRGMLDASATVERLRGELPPSAGALRDLPFRTRVADTLTLSTFHGCPPDEIERILDHLLRTHGLHCIVKLNPTLLGRDEVAHLLHDVLGYRDVRVPDEAFAKDTTWEQATGFVTRLSETARSLGLGFGVKLTNTLVVEHDGGFLPASERVKYLSGRPLHVLAVRLAARVRERFGASLPISFSAGIDQGNFADAVALGLTPITVCSDLLAPGGYGRQASYLAALDARMDAVGAHDLDAFVRATAGGDVPRDEAVLRNTRAYAEAVLHDVRYAAPANATPPKKIGSALTLFECVTCDKCIPVCPNDANFTLAIEPRELVTCMLRPAGDRRFEVAPGETIALAKRHQIANFADLCNECGNCDVFCPEDGGPYLAKPRVFGSDETFEADAPRDGFLVEREGDGVRVRARFGGVEHAAEFEPGRVRYRAPGCTLELPSVDEPSAARGEADGPVDLRWLVLMDVLRVALLERGAPSWVRPD
ncbi:MAG: glutamate synthase [Planctomycetes bacterium]|nr:glutamate synthase [Planctomycetota bacterium]